MNVRVSWAIVLVLGWLGFVGCDGGGVRPIAVKGVVTVDGKPEPGIAVNFLTEGNPGKNPARGVTDAEGKFSLTTYNSNDGAAPGSYRVTVARAPTYNPAAGGAAPGDSSGPGKASADQMAKMGEMMMKGAEGHKAAASTVVPLPAKYLSPETTPLSATVGKTPPGQTEFTIEVSTK